jgi:hypothetical protein
MEFQQLLKNVFERAAQTVEKAFDGLTQDDLRYLPKTECNSIAWLTWHLSRIQDRAVSYLLGKKELWISDKWHSKFGRSEDMTDNGMGHNSEDVSNFHFPDIKTLLDYHRNVLKQTKEYMSKLSTPELERETNNPRLPTVGLLLTAVISDSLQHVGQIAYLRGMITGSGWYGA